MARLPLLTLVLVGAATVVSAQEAGAPLSAGELTEMLRPQGASLDAQELTAILAPRPRTRSLSAGTGAEPVAPGDPGSGVVPSLQIQFDYNSAAITSRSRRQLDELGRALRSEELEPFRFRIAGHTDAAGSAQYNDALSKRRAAAVADYLEANHEIAETRLESVGYGKRELLDPANPRSAVNRRVEVRTLD